MSLSRNIFVLLFSSVILASLFYFQKTTSNNMNNEIVVNDHKANTIEEAIRQSKIPFSDILYVKKIQDLDMRIVFYNFMTETDQLSLGAAILDGNNQDGWELLGNYVDHSITEHFTVNEIPLKINFQNSQYEDIIFGYIQDPNIKTIKVRTRDGSLEDGSFHDANIINSNGNTLYFYFREDRSRTQVIGLSESGEIISSQG